MTRRPPTRSVAVFNHCDAHSYYVTIGRARNDRQLGQDVAVSAPDTLSGQAWRGRVQSVERAVALLDAIAGASPRGSTVAELALACGINRATAWRLLATLEGQDRKSTRLNSSH